MLGEKQKLSSFSQEYSERLILKIPLSCVRQYHYKNTRSISAQNKLNNIESVTTGMEKNKMRKVYAQLTIREINNFKHTNNEGVLMINKLPELLQTTQLPCKTSFAFCQKKRKENLQRSGNTVFKV